MISIDEYLRNPCRIASIPYRKAVRIDVPENMKIVHEDDFCADMLELYIDEPYFRLLHNLRIVDPIAVPAGYSLCRCSVGEFVAHIDECYGNGLTPAEVYSYIKREVYCAELWLMLRNEETGKIVAPGIAELDQEIEKAFWSESKFRKNTVDMAWAVTS